MTENTTHGTALKYTREKVSRAAEMVRSFRMAEKLPKKKKGNLSCRRLALLREAAVELPKLEGQLQPAHLRKKAAHPIA